MAIEPNKIIYSMIGVSKFYDKKPVLKDISLSYFYGAKIGVLGLNGSGKSSCCGSWPGWTRNSTARPSFLPATPSGFLEQEPQLDDDEDGPRDRRGRGAGDASICSNEFNAINEKFAEPMSDDEMNKLIERQGEVQEKLDALDAWDLDSRLEMAMDALRCPPARHAGQDPLRRRKAPRGPVPAASPETRHPAPGRADQPPGRRVRGLAGAPPAALSRAPSSPSPTTATSWTTWPAGSWNWTGARASPGRATTPPGWSRSRTGCARRKKRRASGRRPCSGSWSGSA